MRKYVFLIFIISCIPLLSAQKKTLPKGKQDSRYSLITTLLEDIDTRLLVDSTKDRFKLYPTENIYNFIELDTYTGIIKQIQWHHDTDKEISYFINREDISCGTQGAFELYPTQNIYQFLLLDKSNGGVWHVQWGLDNNERWIRRIL